MRQLNDQNLFLKRNLIPIDKYRINGNIEIILLKPVRNLRHRQRNFFSVFFFNSFDFSQNLNSSFAESQFPMSLKSKAQVCHNTNQIVLMFYIELVTVILLNPNSSIDQQNSPIFIINICYF